MLYNQAQALLRRAAGAALERIAGDRSRSPWKVRPLLDYLEANLFDPDLNVDQLKRACGVRDNSIAVAFHSAVGQPPGAYISERRLETAGKLLCETKLPIWQISDLVGYSSIQVFSRSFSRWAGKSPGAYRRGGSQANAHLPPPAEIIKAADESDQLPTPAILLRQHFDSERAEELEAEELWLALRNHSWELQRTIARQSLGFRSIAFFELLLKKARQEGRDNRERGVEIVTLAIESLTALQGCLDPAQLAGLAARGWAWLGNAYRLKLSFQDAEAAFQVAESHLAKVPDDLLARGEVQQNRGALFWYQRRYKEALVLEEHAFQSFRTLGQADLMALALVLKAAIHESAGNLESTIPILLEARALIETQHEPFLTLTINQWLVATYVQAGYHQEAAAILPGVKTMALEMRSPRVAAHMMWVEGRIEQLCGRLESAETRYVEAHSAFEQLEDSFHMALVAFDLTTVYSLTYRFSEIVALASEMLSVFAAIGLPQESLLALRVLQQGISSDEATQDLLRKIRVGLEEIQQDPQRQMLRP